MSETREATDPISGKTVTISNNLVDRLRGKYAVGPTMPNGEPEFGYRQMPAVSIQDEAAAEIVRLRAAMAAASDLLMEKTHGNPARSAGHNARLTLEAALRPVT